MLGIWIFHVKADVPADDSAASWLYFFPFPIRGGNFPGFLQPQLAENRSHNLEDDAGGGNGGDDQGAEIGSPRS